MSKSARSTVDPSRKALNLILALDQIRDEAPDPAAMFGRIVGLLADEFQADLSLLALIHRDTGELELKAVNDRADLLAKFGADAIRAMAEKAIPLLATQVWDGKTALREAGLKGRKDLEKLHLIILPILMGNRARLGALMLVRPTPLKESEKTLLDLIESQLDSAVIQGHTYFELHLRNKELETIYRIDRIRDQHLPFDDMLSKVLHELRGVIQAQMGFIMLYQQATSKLEMRAVTHDDLFHSQAYYEAINRVASEALDNARLVFYNGLSKEIDSVMCIPLILRDEILGVFGVVNGYGSRGFDQEDRRLLSAIASQMDTAIFEGLEKRRLRQVLGRSVDPGVMEKLLANPDSGFLKGERAIISVLYADIRGSTALAERTPPELLVGFINDYLGTMADVILKSGGTLDKFVGDEVMAFFGAPHPNPDHALQAARVGLLMHEAHDGVMQRWQPQGVTPSPIGIGIATGELIVGEMGSEQRTNYTVIGNAANLGARICGHAGPGQVLVSRATYDLIKDKVEASPISGLQMKGVSGDVTVYHVTGINE